MRCGKLVLGPANSASVHLRTPGTGLRKLATPSNYRPFDVLKEILIFVRCVLLCSGRRSPLRSDRRLSLVVGVNC